MATEHLTQPTERSKTVTMTDTDRTEAPSKAFRTWSARLDGPTLTKSEIQQLTSTVYPRAHGTMTGRRTNLTETEAAELVASIGQGWWALTPEHNAQGRYWCARYWRKVGLPESAADVTSFLFLGCQEVECNTYRCTFAPIYEAHCADGRAFRYVPWTSGGRWVVGVDWWPLSSPLPDPQP